MRLQKEAGWLLHEKHHGKRTPRFLADLKRLKKGEPLAYVIGWLDFLGCRIDLSFRPLIPRPETEFWTEQVIQRLRLADRQCRILDLFAGSGCIGIALLKHLPRANVHFGEKDSRALRQIRKNLHMNHVPSSRAKIVHTDIFSRVSGSYDIIVANPPYIDTAKRTTVQKSVLAYEPKGALFANKRGLFFIEQLLAQGAKHLSKGGIMYIEFGHVQKRSVEKLARAYGWNPTFTKDQFGKWRSVTLVRP